MGYKFFEDIAVADVAYEASGKTLEALFESAGLALTNTMVKDLDSVKLKVTKKIKLEFETEEMLLFNFLQELIFLKDAKLLLFSKYKLKISKSKKGFLLNAELKGEELDMKKHELIVDVKAVSFHMFKLEKTKLGFKAFVILDV
ncbi:archease [Candidatus Micrarchaeota archaeon]|nr:archease [Candidatus Micrarchaeota archaeon]